METIRFEDLNIAKDIMKAIEDMGFEEATPIQANAIPPILKGKDIIGQAQTGTGKTAAFGIPILEKININNKNPQAIILCPTRELAIQVAEELKRLAKHMQNIYTLPVYGGQAIKRQIKALKKGVQIIIGTPGRVMDHMRRGTLNLTDIDFVVLDEADVMLDMGFIDDIETILKDTPANRQTLFFSATIPGPIRKLSKRYQKNSQFIKVAHEKLTVPSIEQYYYDIRRSDKLKVVTRLIDLYTPKLSIIFCNTRKMVDELNIQLQARGYLSDALHGGLNQAQRDRVMDKFKNGIAEILIATDVAARGIDIDDIELVINYDLPQDTDYYVHRIGRTGRAGRSGRAITFVVGKDIYKLRDIQKYTKTKIKRQEIPTISDIEDAKMEKFTANIVDSIEEGHLGKYINIVEGLVDDDYTPMEIAAALIKNSLEKDSPEEEIQSNDFGDTGAEPGMVRLFINLGKQDNVSPRHFVAAIAGETSIAGNLIGAIDVYKNFTFVEVPSEYGQEVLQIMKNNYIKGSKINIEPAKPK
ncbi:MAG: DEAD/DEAH box helicase [Bacillota bacterium]